MPYEIDDTGVRLIGYNVPIEFYDPERILQQTIHLRDDDMLSIGDVVVSAGAPGGGGGGMSTHALSGALHTGMLGNAQAPQFLLKDGTRDLEGNLLVQDAHEIQFRDSDLAIWSSADGQLDLKADTTIAIHIGGAVDFMFTANAFNVPTDSGIVMADDTRIGITAGVKLIFEESTSPQQVKLTSGNFNLASYDLILDSDNDTYLHASADDVVDLVLAGAGGEFAIWINGAEDFKWTANTYTILAGSSLVIEDLTATRLLMGSAGRAVTSTSLASWVTGTANRVSVADNGDGTITLSGPQDLATSSSPTFAGLTINGNIVVTGTVDGVDVAAHAARHEVGGADLVYHDNLIGFVADEHVAHSGVTLTAGAGLTGGGTIAANRTFAVGAGAGITVNADDVALTTPGTLTVATSNSAAGNHTHAVTSSSNPGAAASLLASDASGYLRLVRLGIGVAPADALSVNGNISIPAGSNYFQNYDPSSQINTIQPYRVADGRMVFNTYYWNSPTVGGFQFQAGGNNRVTITGLGNVGIGTTIPDRLLHSEVADAGTNTIVYPFRVTHATSGAPIALYGVGAEHELEDLGGALQVASECVTLWASSIAGAESPLRRWTTYPRGSAGPGYMGFWTWNDLTSIPRTIIPDGAGDVTAYLWIRYVITSSGGGGPYTGTAEGIKPGDAPVALATDTDSCNIAVNANGSVGIVSSGSTDMFDVSLLMNWI